MSNALTMPGPNQTDAGLEGYLSRQQRLALLDIHEQ
jgi:hypothetical protein